MTEPLAELNLARSYLLDAESEATNGLTASAKFIDQRVTQAREAIDRAILTLHKQIPSRYNPQ